MSNTDSMRIFKLVVISIVLFAILIVGLSALFPSNVRISRAINIGAPMQKVHQGLEDLKEWQYWNDMTTQEYLTNKNFSDSAFASDQMKVQLLSASPDLVLTSWNRNENEAIKSGFQLVAADDSTVVQWYFDFKLKWYPWEKFGSIIFDKQLGPAMESSLSRLKKFIENNQ